jgi:hypothetical protein
MKAPKMEDYGLRSRTQVDYDDSPVTQEEYAQAFQMLMDNQVLALRLAKYEVARDQYMWRIANR